MKEAMKLLGLKVEDAVTGMKGVVTSVVFDLYGCIQALVNPGLDKDGKAQDSNWYDVKRLRVLDPKAVMPVPDFEGSTPESVPGPADKPAFRQLPKLG